MVEEWGQNSANLFKKLQTIRIIVISEKDNGGFAWIGVISKPLQSRVPLPHSAGFLPLRILQNAICDSQVAAHHG